MATGVSQARATARTRRHFRLRKKVVGSATRPRLVVNRSSRHIGVQLVDDTVGKTLASASTLEADLRTGRGRQDRQGSQGRRTDRRAGEASRCRLAVVFDRGGDKYHGRIAALADGARGAGLEF